ncbi:MAG: hypothetical protein ACRDL7_13630, partial [Gaiellaceae bacterium]
LYRQLKDSNEWLPTTKTQRAFNVTVDSRLTQIADSNIKGKSDGTTIRCFKCGGPHYANKCPNKNDGKSGVGRSQAQKKSNDKEKSWKRVAPNSGSATQKTVDGQSFKWCGKCRRWTVTHSTEEHRDKRGQGGDSRAMFAEDDKSYASRWLVSD